LLQTSFQTQALGDGASTMNGAHEVTEGMPGIVSVAQLVIVDPTAAVNGIVKLISKYTHWPGFNVPVVVAVTLLPTSVTFRIGDEAPSVTPVRVAGTLSVTV